MAGFGEFKKIIKKNIVKIKSLRKPSIFYCLENDLLPELIVKTPSKELRKLFNLPFSDYQSQLNQDFFALLMNRFSSGYFLEIGANDGFTLSNTVYLEEKFHWKGILVEANQRYLSSLEKRKKAVVVNKAIANEVGPATFIDAGLYGGLAATLGTLHIKYTRNAPEILVECIRLQDLLDEAKAPELIDFISVDVEGGEVSIVEQMVTTNRRFRCGCIECNGFKEKTNDIKLLLESNGYEIVWGNVITRDLFFKDRGC